MFVPFQLKMKMNSQPNPSFHYDYDNWKVQSVTGNAHDAKVSTYPLCCHQYLYRCDVVVRVHRLCVLPGGTVAKASDCQLREPGFESGVAVSNKQ